jgi:hypothetical protein
MAGKNQHLELFKAMNELVQGFRSTAPLLREVIEQMQEGVSGRDAMGWMNSVDKIVNASEDDCQVMVILSVQWIATVIEASKSDPALRNKLVELFPNSVLLGLV